MLGADHQTAGRGRRDRRRDDTSGGTLLVSFRLPASGDGAREPTEVAHDAVAAVGAAARAACARFVPVPVSTKWPNDVVVLGGPVPGKLAGVLADFVSGPEPVVVVGLGCNVEPVATQPDATSLRQCGAGDVDRDRLLAAVIEELATFLVDPGVVHRELVAHSATVGSAVRVELADGSVLDGTATGLSANGRLEITTPDGGRRSIAAGDVCLLYTSDAADERVRV